MSVSGFDVGTGAGRFGDDNGSGADAEHRATSPFAPATLLAPGGEGGNGGGGDLAAVTVGEALLTPFSESMTADVDGEPEVELAEALLAEFADDEFDEVLEALADELAGRHLRAVGTWSYEAEAPVLATAEVEQWMESIAAESDRILGELEAHFADRPVDTLRDGELEAVTGLADDTAADITGPAGFTGPADLQEQFFKKLLRKAKKVVKGVAKVARKGLRAVGRVLPLGRLFGLLRRLVRPLLRNVLRRAIGRLPARLRPLARRLATRFAREAGASEADAVGPGESLAEEFDRQLADLVVAGNEAAVEQLLAEAEADAGDGPGDAAPGPLHDLDAARARLARELVEADPGQQPTAQLEQFIPAVMAAMPLIRAGLRVVGRQRVVNFLAGALAGLIKDMVGARAATQLSRHIASTGLKLLGLEAGNGTEPALGTEALVAAAEDTVRHVASLPPESIADELLLEAEIQEAFAEAAARHLPAAVLRPELVAGESAGEHAVWVMMPRVTRPSFRYKKYGRLVPVRITRPVARAVMMSGGDTLERRLLDAGVRSWPVDGELELYELLEGAELGHLAAFEGGDVDDIAAAATEFEELTGSAAAVLAGNPRLAATMRYGPPRRGGTRYYRLRVGAAAPGGAAGRGAALRRRSLFGLRLDLSSPRPVLAVHLRLGERDTHAIAAHLERRRLVQVVSEIRRLVDPAMRRALALRLERMLGRHGVTPASGALPRQAQRLADAMLRAVSGQLPAAAATLARAARDPADGATLTFGFTFGDKAAIATAPPGEASLTIQPGYRRD